MMIANWPLLELGIALELILGLALGIAVSASFFWGLNYGITQALDSPHPSRTLLMSFVLRMALLLGVGFALAAVSASLWPLFGYVLAFFVVRAVSIRRARRAILAASTDKGTLDARQ